MFESRIKKLQDLLDTHEIDALLITSSYNIAYLTGIRAFSIEEREARILITETHVYLFTDARYTGMVKDLSFLRLIEVSAANPYLKQLNRIVEDENIKSLGFEEESITYKETSDLEEKIKVEFIPTEDIVESLRVIKDNSEIENIRKACALTDKAFDYIIKNIKTGDSELEVKIKLENYIHQNGGEISFPSIVAIGANSAIPHHLASNSKLQTPNIILLDFGAKVDGYCSDMTRTIFMGKPTDEMLKAYNTVKEAQEVAIDFIKTHKKDDFELKNAHELANSHLGFLGFSDIPHGLGHGVGLQVHESPTVSPFSDEKLAPGSVITVEPGVYLNGVFGVRIEDTALVTQDGLEILTKSSKDEIVI